MFKKLYNHIIESPYIFIALIQLILLLVGFNKIIFQPNDYMFVNSFDGLKNYFTFTQYIAQENSKEGFLHFFQMNYPFGEYVFFTDNTPFFAVILKFVNTHLFSIENHTVAIHNYLFLALLYLSTFAFFYLIKPKNKHHVAYAIIIAICVAWINPQVYKLFSGVFNLSVSLFIILALIFMKKIDEFSINNQKISILKIAVFLAILIFTSGLFHIYYIPILAAVLGVFIVFFYLVFWIKNKQFQLLNFSLLLSAIAIGSLAFYFFVQHIDNYADLRKNGASGYGWIVWNFTPEALIAPYKYNTLQPILKSCNASEIHNESHGFLGNFVFYLWLCVVAIMVGFKLNFLAQLKKIYSNPFLIALVIAAIITYAISMGNRIDFCFTNTVLKNYLSPFFYLYDKIDLITHFRCLGRFSWFGFWIVFYLSVKLFFKSSILLEQKNKNLYRLFTFGLLTILLWDTKDTIKHLNSLYEPNLFKNELLESKFSDVKNKISFDDFQAIYTIPIVNVGSEDYNITIDDQNEWTVYWMQLSAYSKLPLFNCKMSRTALSQANAKIDLILNKKVSNDILDNVNDAPILVVYSPFFENNFDLKIHEPAKTAIENGSKIIETFKMDTLFVKDDIYYLSWNIKNNH